MQTVAAVRSKYSGQSKFNIPRVREYGQNIGQGKIKLLLADGGVGRPGEVAAETADMN